MKKNYIFLVLFIVVSAMRCFPANDSLNPFTEKEILKLSSVIYELEKRDSIARASEPNGFDLKNSMNISDKSLLVDLNNDSIHYYTGRDVIRLSNYIFELERRDSIRKANDSIYNMIRTTSVVYSDTIRPNTLEYHMEEEEDIKNFESVIFFSFNSSSITPDSYKALDDIIKVLKTYINLTFVIEGYTDNAGSPSYNKVLSMRRAKAVKEYFVSKGIAASRVVSVVGFGGSKFMYNNDTEEGKAKNRNVIVRAYH